VKGYQRAIMSLEPSAVSSIKRCSNYVNVVTSASQPTSQSFSKPRRPVDVWGKGVTSENYLELLGH
jgi:hypothetical protein